MFSRYSLKVFLSTVPILYSLTSVWRRVQLTHLRCAFQIRAFRNVLWDYKNIQRENRRTRIYKTCTDRRICQDLAFVPPMPHDLADLKARINAAVKNIDAHMLTRVWQELECCILWCTHRTSLVVKKSFFFSFPVAVNNSIKVGPLVFLL
jgi:hypothetical protein